MLLVERSDCVLQTTDSVQ